MVLGAIAAAHLGCSEERETDGVSTEAVHKGEQVGPAPATTRPVTPQLKVDIVSLYTVDGGNHGGQFGWSVGPTRDLDRDGVPDFMVGAHRDSDPALRRRCGSVRLCSGRDGTEIRTLRGGESVANFGVSLADVGDVNGDAVADQLIGATDDQATPGYRGAVHLFSGSDGRVIRRLTGDKEDTYFGFRVARAGEIASDGKRELLVASTWATRNGMTYAGVLVVFDSLTGSVVRTLSGSKAHQRLGRSLVVIGDVNGDGVLDYAVGCQNDRPSDSGTVRLFSGRDGTMLWEYIGTLDGEEVGIALADAGDIDGDGVRDLIAGCRRVLVNRGRATCGARVLSGKSGFVLRTIEPPADAQTFGLCVAGIGDVDGDGVPDQIVTDESFDGATVNEGRVYLYSGVDGRLLATVSGQTNSNFGQSVASVGDLNGDGRNEFAVGAPSAGLKLGGCVTVYTTRAALSTE